MSSRLVFSCHADMLEKAVLKGFDLQMPSAASHSGLIEPSDRNVL